jgi:RNA polymerase sigma-70 factor (ECF subfamily)
MAHPSHPKADCVSLSSARARLRRAPSEASAPSLETLLAAVALGDRAAFRHLYDATSGHLLMVAMRVLHRRELAEEALQDAYTKVWHHAGGFEASKATPMTWLINIVRNRAIDLLRAARGERASVVLLDDDDDTTLQVPAPDADQPHEACQAQEDRWVLARGIATLSPAQRQAITMAYHGGLSHPEVAAAMGVPLGTSKAWVRRGLAALRAHFEGEALASRGRTATRRA